jgi:hypothetical protein
VPHPLPHRGGAACPGDGGVLLRGDSLSDEVRVIAVRLHPCLQGLAVGSMAELAGMGHAGGEIFCVSPELRMGTAGGCSSC